MSLPAPTPPKERKPRKKRWPTLVYVVEVAPCVPDPKAARDVLEWILARRG